MPAERGAPASARPLDSFFRVFNLRAVALVFYLCLTIVVSRWLLVAFVSSEDTWLLDGLRFLRQNLISGLTMLVAVAWAQASLERHAGSPRHAVSIGVAAVAAAAAVGAIGRLLVFGVPLAELHTRWTWGVGILGLWALLGAGAFALFHFSLQDESARQALARGQSQRDELEAQMLQAHLSGLQAQIEPHFLFNTLATVKRLFQTEPARGRDMLASLIDYLRAALPQMRQSGSTLRRELDLARAYLTILQMRMGDRLRFSIEAADDLLGAVVPPLVLATLVENAIKHGLTALPQGGAIAIRADRRDNTLRIEVHDNGRGFAEVSGSGVGLANTRSRLAALFGEQAALTLRAAEPHGVVATVSLPLQMSSAGACA